MDQQFGGISQIFNKICSSSQVVLLEISKNYAVTVFVLFFLIIYILYYFVLDRGMGGQKKKNKRTNRRPFLSLSEPEIGGVRRVLQMTVLNN